MLPTPELIFDTNVLSNFALAGQLQLLRAMYPLTARCTGHVAAEVNSGLRAGHLGLAPLAEVLLAGWPVQEQCATLEERRLFAGLAVSLGSGEASCIALAATRGYVFACDDRLARREAESLGVRLTGTIGVLVKAVRIGRIELVLANRILKEMIEAGFYSPVASLSREMVG